MLGWALAAVALGTPMECSGRQEDITLCEVEECGDANQCSPVNGAWAEWGEWSSCSCSGVTERHRAIAQHAICGGLQVEGPEIEAKDCQPTCHKDEPKMCEMSEWTDWSSCDRDCGGGERFQARYIAQFSKNCGTTCHDEALKRSEGCNMHECGVVLPCEVSDWSSWGECSATCGGGQMQRVRQIVSEAQGAGEGCSDALVQTMGCSQQCCTEGPQDCVWSDWTDWSEASATCGGGVQSRTRAVELPRIGTGKDCEDVDVMQYKVDENTLTGCDFIPPEDGEWGPWNEWSVCSRTCGEGFRQRMRVVAKQPAHGGTAAEGPATVFETCDMGACNTDAINCAFGTWSVWSACSATFKGTQSRSRPIAVYAANNGLPCDGPLAEVKPCNDMELVTAQGEPEDCVFDEWLPWGYCSKTCGGGTKDRKRVVKHPRKNGGKPCEGTTLEATPCNQQVCHPDCDHDVDCEWAPWQAWSACSTSCGGGERTRYRSIASPAMNFGQACEADDSRQVQACNTHHCGQELFCVWGDWSAFSPCSATCGAGTRKRERELESSPDKTSDALDMTYLAQQTPALGASGLILCSTAGLASVLVAAMLLRVVRGRGSVPDQE